MQILVTYGLHKEELEFGQLVSEVYQRLYSPDRSVLEMHRMMISATRKNVQEEKLAQQEQMFLLSFFKPCFFVDIHHSKGFDPGKIEVANMVVSIVENLHKLYPPKYSAEEAGPIVKELVRLVKERTQPLEVQYTNPEVDVGFLQYLSKQDDLGSMIPSAEHLERFCINQSRPVCYFPRYIVVEARLFGNGNEVNKDQRYYEAADKSVELIHRIHDYVVANNSKNQSA